MTVWIEAPFDSLPIEGYRKQRYWLMAEAFAAAGHRVVYWTSDFSHAKKRFRFQVPGSRFQVSGSKGIELRFVKTRPYRKNVSWARVRSHRAYAREWERQAVEFVAQSDNRTIEQSNNSPDLVISSIPPISAAVTGLKLARRFGAKFVLDVMDAWPETFERLAPTGFRWLAKLLLSSLRRTVRRLYREADLVTGVCERYRELTGRPDYYLAYHGIEVGEKRLANSQRPTADSSVIRLAYIGNLGKTYDLKTVAEGVELLKKRGVSVTLDIAGFGDSAVRLPTATADLRFHGMLGEAALGNLLADCDIGIIPMKPDSWVGLPYKLCDYATADLRIVSSLGGESGRLLEKYRCGVLYRPGDAQSFADAVVAAQNCRGGRVLVEQVLDAKKIYREYVEKVL